MKVHEFDIKKGVYHFELHGLTAEIHAHPVLEIINASKGTFSLTSSGRTYDQLVFAIIQPNISHSVAAEDCTAQILMVESHNASLSDWLVEEGIKMENGIFAKRNFTDEDQVFLKIKHLAVTEDFKTPTDPRISDCIQFMEENDLAYKNLIPALKAKVFLSDSRLSHLFKEHIGVSIKKYLVWNKLRQAINQYLNEQTNLTDVSLQSGFFDQAHLSNSFKSVLGVSPSTAYNSRTLQS